MKTYQKEPMKTKQPINTCVKEILDHGFVEVKNKYTDLGRGYDIPKNTKSWHYSDQKVDFLVLYSYKVNHWDLFAHVPNDYHNPLLCDYALQVKPGDGAFMSFFNNFTNDVSNYYVMTQKKKKAKAKHHGRR